MKTLYFISKNKKRYNFLQVVYLNLLFVSLCQALGQCGRAKRVTFFSIPSPHHLGRR